MGRITRAEAKQQTRAALLHAAAGLFADVGYNAATVEGIVDAAGFTRGAFYAHFADKADCFTTLLAENQRRAMRRVADRVAAVDDGDKIAVIQRWYDGLDDERPWSLAYAEFWPQAVRDDRLRARLADIHRETHAAISSMLADYCDAAGIDLPIPVAELASMVLAVGDGIATQRSLDPGALPPDAFTRTVTYLWFGVLGDRHG